MISAFFVSICLCLDFVPYADTVDRIFVKSPALQHNDATRENSNNQRNKCVSKRTAEEMRPKHSKKNVKHLGDCGITSNPMEFTANLKLRMFFQCKHRDGSIHGASVWVSELRTNGTARWQFVRPTETTSESNNGTEKLKYVPNEAFSKLNLPKNEQKINNIETLSKNSLRSSDVRRFRTAITQPNSNSQWTNVRMCCRAAGAMRPANSIWLF